MFIIVIRYIQNSYKYLHRSECLLRRRAMVCDCVIGLFLPLVMATAHHTLHCRLVVGQGSERTAEQSAADGAITGTDTGHPLRSASHYSRTSAASVLPRADG